MIESAAAAVETRQFAGLFSSNQHRHAANHIRCERNAHLMQSAVPDALTETTADVTGVRYRPTHRHAQRLHRTYFERRESVDAIEISSC